MKSVHIKLAGLFAVCAMGVLTIVNLATPNVDQQSGTTLAAIQSAKIAEMPAVAAALVGKASPQNQAQVVEQVIRAIVALDRPCSLPYVVSEISRQNPAVAPQAVLAAARLQPTDAFASLKAAVAVVPAQTENIVYAFAVEFPAIAQVAGTMAAAEHPDKSVGILKSLGRAMPELAPFVEPAAAQFGPQADFLTTFKAAQEFAVAAVKQNEQTASNQAVARLLASQLGSPGYNTSDLADIKKFVSVEIAKAEQATAPSASPRNDSVTGKSLAARSGARLVSPATLRVPTPSQVMDDSSADLGIRNSRIYSRP